MANLQLPGDILYSANHVPFQRGPSMERSYPLDARLQMLLPEAKEGSADYKEDDPFQLDTSWDDLVADSVLTRPELRGVVPDVHFAAMAQMTSCILTREDREGHYKTREVGFAGMCCKHCGGVPGFGRYFPASLTSLVHGNVCKSIIKHVSEECRKCPTKIRDEILKLSRQDEVEPFNYRRGSRRQFFSHVWSKIHKGTPQARDEIDSDTSKQQRHGALAGGAGAGSDDSGDENIPWNKLLENSEVVILSDRHLVPDTIFAATAQTKPCQVTEGDRMGRCKDHKLSSMGLCCKHCGGKAGAFGRYFPSNLHSFAQVEVCKQIFKHVTRKCQACPPEIRTAISDLQQLEKTKPAKRYPSRMVFFRRVWHRFHYGDLPEGGGAAAGGDSPGCEDREASGSGGDDTIASQDILWEGLVKDSKLVSIEDKGLISDSQFAAVAQMNICQLTDEDRIGYNKNREIGFVGLCCRFCGGRPGFGRYFPNTVRNFEKTSARDTIVSHVSLFCQECPEDVRNAVLSLKRIESSRDGSATMKGLIYGSGKLFFRRVWSRLHDDNHSDVEKDSKPAAVAAANPSRGSSKTDSDSTVQRNKTDSSDYGDTTGSAQQKRKADPLPFQTSSKKSKSQDATDIDYTN